MSSGLIICLASILLLGAAAIALRNRSKDSYEVVEGEPTVDDERTSVVVRISTVIKYWCAHIVGDNEPTTFSNPEVTLTYIEYPTIIGHIVCQINWARNRFNLHYSYFNKELGVAGGIDTNIKLSHCNPDEPKMAEFLTEVNETENGILEKFLRMRPEFDKKLNSILESLKAQDVETEECDEDESCDEVVED